MYQYLYTESKKQTVLETMRAAGFMVQGPARRHIVSRFGTENAEPIDLCRCSKR